MICSACPWSSALGTLISMSALDHTEREVTFFGTGFVSPTLRDEASLPKEEDLGTPLTLFGTLGNRTNVFFKTTPFGGPVRVTL